MKGIIFNLLEDFITENWGAVKYEEILSMCPVHTRQAFIGPGTYPDADLVMIVSKASSMLGVTVDQACHAFGKYLFPHLAARVPKFMEGHEHPRTFLQTIDSVIHVEVRKLMRDAEPPRIASEEKPDGSLVLRYESKRQLCSLFAGLLEGAGVYFKVPIRYQHTSCMRDGAPSCEFTLQFDSATSPVAA